MNHTSVRNDGLTPSQERAIGALLTARSIAAAARQADVGESSIRRWLHEDEEFQAKLRRLSDEALAHAAFQLQQGASEAAGAMREAVNNEKRVDPGRASLIRATVDYGFRSRIYNDVVNRLKTVEKKHAEAKK